MAEFDKLVAKPPESWTDADIEVLTNFTMTRLRAGAPIRDFPQELRRKYAEAQAQLHSEFWMLCRAPYLEQRELARKGVKETHP